MTAPDENGWMPIETAPRDGTYFIAARMGEGPAEFEIGAYEPYYWPEYIEAGDGLFRKERRIVHEWIGFNNMHRMTHWQPLPKPPVTP